MAGRQGTQDQPGSLGRGLARAGVHGQRLDPIPTPPPLGRRPGRPIGTRQWWSMAHLGARLASSRPVSGRGGPECWGASATGQDQATLPSRQAWSTFGPHAIGAERFATVSSGRSFAQVAGAILQKQAPGQNPDKDEAAGSSPARPTTPGLTCGNTCRRSPSIAVVSGSRLRTAVSEPIPALLARGSTGPASNGG